MPEFSSPLMALATDGPEGWWMYLPPLQVSVLSSHTYCCLQHSDFMS